MQVQRPRDLPAGAVTPDRWVSFSAMGNDGVSENTARAVTPRLPVIPSLIETSPDARPLVASPDWSMMPRRFMRGESGRVTIRRIDSSVSLSALRSDEPVSAGSVFSSGYGSDASPAATSGGESSNFEGKAVFAAPTKYFQDFEDGAVAREWDLSGIDDMEKFGRFAGPYRNSTQVLNVQCEPDTPYVVTFDLLFIAANLGNPAASDVFSVEVDGQPLLEDTFVTLQARNQKFNGDRGDFDRDIYKQLSLTFLPKGNGVVSIKFRCAASGLPGGETWGLDNVHIDIAPKQTLGELGDMQVSDFAGGGSLGQLAMGSSGAPFDTAQSYFRGDESLRGNGPTGPTIPPNIPVPSPGAGVTMLAAGLLAARRKRG